MPTIKRRCKRGSRKCGSTCVVTRGMPRIRTRCPKKSRRCPRKTGTCRSTTKKRSKRRYGRY